MVSGRLQTAAFLCDGIGGIWLAEPAKIFKTSAGRRRFCGRDGGASVSAFVFGRAGWDVFLQWRRLLRSSDAASGRLLYRGISGALAG